MFGHQWPISDAEGDFQSGTQKITPKPFLEDTDNFELI